MTTEHEDPLARLRNRLQELHLQRGEPSTRDLAKRVYVLEQGRFPSDANGFPTVLRMLIGNELRRLRQAGGISREAAGRELRASESKISRMELGRIGFKERDVTDLLNLYGITEATERETLIGLVREANQPGWWEQYNDVMPSRLQSYHGMEVAASLIRTYKTLLVPALLQTRQYARAAIELSHPDASPEEIERRVQLLMSRQRLLERDEAHLWAVIDEAVLHRRVGRPGVTQEQLATLARTPTRDTIKIQIVPLDVPVMDRLAVRAAPPDRTAGILTALVRNVPGGALPVASR